jgi:hypothetical protein
MLILVDLSVKFGCETHAKMMILVDFEGSNFLRFAKFGLK